MQVTRRNDATWSDEDFELFFPIVDNYRAILDTEKAKVVCRGCEVLHTGLSLTMESCPDTEVWADRPRTNATL